MENTQSVHMRNNCDFKVQILAFIAISLIAPIALSACRYSEVEPYTEDDFISIKENADAVGANDITIKKDSPNEVMETDDADWMEVIGKINISDLKWHTTLWGETPYVYENRDITLSEITPFYMEYKLPEPIYVYPEASVFTYESSDNFIDDIPIWVYRNHGLDYRRIGTMGYNLISDSDNPFQTIMGGTVYEFVFPDNFNFETKTDAIYDTLIVDAMDIYGSEFFAILSCNREYGVCTVIILDKEFVGRSICQQISDSIEYKTTDEERDIFDSEARIVLAYLADYWNEAYEPFEDKYDAYYNLIYDFDMVPRLNNGAIGLPIYQWEWNKNEAGTDLAQLQFRERIDGNIDVFEILIWPKPIGGEYYKATFHKKLYLYRDTGEVRWQNDGADIDNLSSDEENIR